MPAGSGEKTKLFEKPPASASQRKGEAQVRRGNQRTPGKKLISDSPCVLVIKPSING